MGGVIYLISHEHLMREGGHRASDASIQKFIDVN